jgi:hypothetical protein
VELLGHFRHYSIILGSVLQWKLMKFDEVFLKTKIPSRGVILHVDKGYAGKRVRYLARRGVSY